MIILRCILQAIAGTLIGFVVFFFGYLALWAVVGLITWNSKLGSEWATLSILAIPVGAIWGFIRPLAESDEKKIERKRKAAWKKNIHRDGLDVLRIKGSSTGFRDGELAALSKERRDSDGDIVYELWIWFQEKVVYHAGVAKDPENWEGKGLYVDSYIPGRWERALSGLAAEARSEEKRRLKAEGHARRTREAEQNRRRIAAEKKKFGI